MGLKRRHSRSQSAGGDRVCLTFSINFSKANQDDGMIVNQGELYRANFCPREDSVARSGTCVPGDFSGDKEFSGDF